MPDERVSILGVLQDQISPGFKKVAEGAKSVEAAVAGANKSVDALSRSQVDADKSANRMIARSALLTSRLIALQLATQSLSQSFPKGFEQIQRGIGAATNGLTTFGAIASAFPKKAGLVAGGVLGIATSFAQLAAEVVSAIDQIEKKSKDLLDRSDKNFVKVIGSVARAEAEAHLQTPIERDKAKAEQARKDFLDQTQKAKEVEQQLKDIEKQRLDIRKQLDDLAARQVARDQRAQQLLSQPNGAFANQGALAQIGTEEATDKSKAKELTKDLGNLDRSTQTLNGTLRELQDNLTVNFLKFSALDAQVKRQPGLEAYRAALSRINDQLRENDEAFRRGSTDGISATERELGLLRDKQKLLSENRDTLIRQGEDALRIDKEIFDLLKRIGVLSDDLKNEKPAKEKDGPLDPNSQEAFNKGLMKSLESMSSLESMGQQLAGTLASGAAGLADTLVDGLITGDLALKEFAQNFLANIAKMIAQAIILKAITAGLGLVFNEGGPVPIARASGGPIPGPNVDRDVVPAMLTPGEYVIRKSAVEHYGLGVMEALNRRMLDASGLRGTSAPVIHKAERYYAGGGEVGGPVSSASPTPVFAIVPPTEQNMERMLNGGLPALFKVFEQHKETIRGKLGIRGR